MTASFHVHSLLVMTRRALGSASAGLAFFFPRMRTASTENGTAIRAPIRNSRGSVPGGRRVMKTADSICDMKVVVP